MWKDLDNIRHWVTIGYDSTEISIVPSKFINGKCVKKASEKVKEVVVSIGDPDMYTHLAKIIHTSGGYLMGSASVL